jgi:two-component system NtrC family sensor kinase
MIGLGHLVAGLAHEINNPLTFALGNLVYLKGYGQDLLDILAAYEQYYPQPHLSVASVIEEKELDFLKADLPKLHSSMDGGLKRIEKIVIAFKTFSQLGKSSQREIDILKSLDSCLLILQSRLAAQGDREGITIVKDYMAIPPIYCHGSLINQVFMHLLDNAIDAIRQTSVKALQMEEPTIWLGVRYLDEKDQIMISIRDNGAGIIPDIRSHIFDPFFTTKDVGKGLGLGLAVSYQIITVQHQGSLIVNEIPLGGTEFVIMLPQKRLTLLTEE